MADWSTIMRKIAGARNYSSGELALVPVALVLLGFARLVIAALPLRAYRGWLGRQADIGAPTGGDDPRAKAIGRSVRATAAILPWRADCLPQAMAAAAMLRATGIPYRLSIGWPDRAKSLEDQPMLAHAWVEAGGRIVTGAPLRPDLKARLVFAG